MFCVAQTKSIKNQDRNTSMPAISIIYKAIIIMNINLIKMKQKFGGLGKRDLGVDPGCCNNNP